MSPFVCVFILLGLSIGNAMETTTAVEWDKFILDSDDLHEEISSLYFSGMAIHGERIFLSLFEALRIKSKNALITLMSSSISSNSSLTPPPIHPFPSMAMHVGRTCDTLNLIRGLAADTEGRLWVLEGIRKGCNPRLLIFDLENNDEIHTVHYFLRNASSPKFRPAYLRDIALDKTPEGWLAYIAEYVSHRLVVFSLEKNQSWALNIGRTAFQIAVTPREEERKLVFDSDDQLFSIPVSQLRAGKKGISPTWIDHCSRFVADMVIDHSNVVYAAFASAKFLVRWNLSTVPNVHEEHVNVPDLAWENGLITYPLTIDSNDTLWIMERHALRSYFSKYRLVKVQAENRLPEPPATCAPADKGSERNVEDNHPFGVADLDLIVSIAANCILITVLLWLVNRLQCFAHLSRISSEKHVQNSDPVELELAELEPPVEATAF